LLELFRTVGIDKLPFSIDDPLIEEVNVCLCND